MQEYTRNNVSDIPTVMAKIMMTIANSMKTILNMHKYTPQPVMSNCTEEEIFKWK